MFERPQDPVLGNPRLLEKFRRPALPGGNGDEDMLRGDILVLETGGLVFRLCQDPACGGGKVNLRGLAVDFRACRGEGSGLPLQGGGVRAYPLDDGSHDAVFLPQKGEEDVLHGDLGVVFLLGDGGSRVQGFLGFDSKFFVIHA